MPIAISIVPEGFAAAEKALKNVANGFPRAAADAINRGLISGRKQADQGIRARYNIKSAAVKSELLINKANWSSLSGSLEAKGPMIPLGKFAPTVKVKRVARRGARRQFVTVTIIKGSRKLVKGAFMAKGRIWERRQDERTPIYPVSTIGIPYMVGYVGVAKKVEETIARVTAQRLEHNVNRLLAVAGGKGG